MPGSAIFKRNPDMVARCIGAEVVLLPIYKTSDEINCIYSLNPDASRIWQKINGKTTLREINKQIAKELNVSPKEIDQQTKKIINELKQIKAII